MDENKQQLIILGAIVLILLIVVAPKAETVKERKTSSYKDWGRDPFAVGSAAAELSGDLVLTGILWEEGKPYCIINGRIAKVGHEIAGCKILKIEKDNVTVRVGDEIRVLRIGGK